MCFNKEVDQGRKDGEKADFEVIVLQVLREETSSSMRVASMREVLS